MYSLFFDRRFCSSKAVPSSKPGGCRCPSSRGCRCRQHHRRRCRGFQRSTSIIDDRLLMRSFLPSFLSWRELRVVTHQPSRTLAGLLGLATRCLHTHTYMYARMHVYVAMCVYVYAYVFLSPIFENGRDSLAMKHRSETRTKN